MDFISMLKDKQRELQLTTTEFARHVGKNRSWMFDKFGPSPYKHPLNQSTMYQLHNLLNIPYEVMDEFNTKCRGNK